MLRKLMSILFFSAAGYVIFQNRYKVMNMILGNAMLRRIAVTSMMGIPGVKSRMVRTVFSGPSEFN
jgi:hypothetical protein